MAAAMALFSASSAFAASLRIVTYNVDDDTGGGGTDARTDMTKLGAILQGVGNHHLDGSAQPIDVLAVEELHYDNPGISSTLSAIVNQLNGIYGAGTYAYDSYVGDTSGNLTGNGPNGLIYNTHTVQDLGAFGLTKQADGSTPLVSGSGAPRQPVRYELRPLGYASNADFYLYVSHYKASSGTENKGRRTIEADAIRADADALGSSAHIIYAGDFNLTSGSSETAYQDLLAAGNGQANDPLNATGWGNNSASTHILTESSDDLSARFDFQLVSNAMLNQSGMQINPASYQAIGNASTTAYHGAVDDAGNTAALSDLFNRTTILGYMADQTVTDHLPVAADYQTVGILPTTVWTGGSGTWSTASKWMTDVVPNSSSLLATMDDGNNIVSSVTLDTNATVGGVLLDTYDSLTINAGRTLTVTGLSTSTFGGALVNSGTLAINGGTARLLAGGSHAGGFSVASGATLEFAADANTSVGGAITGGGALAKSGTGALTLAGNNNYSGATTVSAGTLTFTQSFRTGSSLDVADGALAALSARTVSGEKVIEVSTLNLNAAGTLDLNDNDLVVDGGDFSTIRNLVLSGYRDHVDAGATGIVSSTSQNAGGNTMLMLFNNALAGATEWPAGSGQSIGSNAIVGKYTYFGDTNLDGQVTAADYNAVDSSLGMTGVDPGIAILDGDTNFDDAINAADYNAVDAGLGLGVGNPLSSASVPEPTSLALLGLGCLAFRRRRRRRSA
jgi:autotransporter-associated beta strand protein